jgi:hypothetical protein
MEYGAESEKQLQTAMRQDPANPRPYLLKAESLKHTPEQFGGGCSPAKEQLAIGKSKLEVYKPLSPLHPNWGKEMVSSLEKNCK